MRQNEYLRAHPEQEAARDRTRESKHLFLAGCADRGQTCQQAGGDRRADARPGDGIVDDVAETCREAAFERELKMLRVRQRILRENGRSPVLIPLPGSVFTD